MSINAVICAPSRLEAAALERGMHGAAVHQFGMGSRAARKAGHGEPVRSSGAVLVAGVGGATHADLGPGDVVVATEVRGPDRTLTCGDPALVAAALRRQGLTVHTGPVASRDHIVTGAERAELGAAGVLCVDMESAWLLEDADDKMCAVVRVVGDTADSPLLRPATIGRMRTALHQLPLVGEVAATWRRAVAEREVLLAGPRSFCAGVVRAIDVVEQALAQRGAPIYVRKQIVHNVHVVRDLQSRGAIFVEELSDVPDGATVVFSAHGVSPQVRAEARSRDLAVIDATCPLVTKVHSEVRRFSARGDTVIFIGHAGHEETVGTMGEHPEATVLVEDAEDAEQVQVADPEKVSYLVQTTLAADEVAGIVDVLKRRFPKLRQPPSDDICYATTNRQQALQEVAVDSDLSLVIGSENSSNSRRLVEKSQRMGTPASLIDDAGDIHLEWLDGVTTVGVTAGASAPTSLVDEVVAALGGLGPVRVVEREVTTENVHFTLPKEVRPA